MAETQRFLKDNRKQVAGLPGRGVQASGIRGGTAGVVVQQPEEPAIMGVARALSGVNRTLGSFAELSAGFTEEGLQKGATAAATSDLVESQKKLDDIGEKLVETGQLPRSMLLGYQQGYRKRIGQRTARETVMKSLAARESEVLDPNAPDNIIEQILAEEIQNGANMLEGKPLAMRGFSEEIERVRFNWSSSALKKRDNAIQRHNESMVVEELNSEFGGLLQAAQSPGDIGKVHVALQQKLDDLSKTSRLTRSRVIELFWSGTAVPAISNLIVTDQPDKAEQMLENILSLDLTGEGGVLGNINREGAYIRSKAVELRNNIEARRDKIEREEDTVGEDIYSEYSIAAVAIRGGITGDEEIDNRSINDVARILMHAGYEETEARQEAESLVASQDIRHLGTLIQKYSENDALREAYGKVLPRLRNVNIQLFTEEQFYQTDAEREDFVEEFTSLKNIDPSLTPNQYARARGITDPQTIAALTNVTIESDQKQWYFKTDDQDNKQKAFEEGLKDTFYATFEPDSKEKAAVESSFYNPYLPRYKEQYFDQLKEASRETSTIKDEGERMEQMRKREDVIRKDLLKRWESLQESLQIYKTRREDLPTTLPGEQELELMKLDLSNQEKRFLREVSALKGAAGMANQAVTFIAKLGTLGIGADLKDVIHHEMGRLRITDRKSALKHASLTDHVLDSGQDFRGKQLDDEQKKATKEYNESLREMFGYENIRQIDIDAKVDWRMTPVFADLRSLELYRDEWVGEKKAYNKEKTPLIEDYPEVERTNDLFGIISNKDFQIFYNTQRGLIKSYGN